MLKSLFLACSLLTACSSEKCNLEAELLARAGKGATDCGQVLVDGDRTATDECVTRAFEDGVAFHARYEARGIDSHVVLGIVRSASGTLTLLHYDGDPSGGGGDGQPVIDAAVCDDPRLPPTVSSRPEGTHPFTCGAERSVGRVCE